MIENNQKTSVVIRTKFRCLSLKFSKLFNV